MRRNIVLIGMPGCGKTSLGKNVARRCKLRFVDMDAYIVRMTGKTVAQLFEAGEETFRDAETQACRRLAQTGGCVIATGGGCVKRAENMRLLAQTGTVVFIDRPVERIVSDVRCDTRPLLKEGAAAVQKLYDERIELYQKYAQVTVRNDGAFFACADEIIRRTGHEDHGNQRRQFKHARHSRKRRLRHKKL